LTVAIERSAAEASDASTSVMAGPSTDAAAMDLNETPPMALTDVTAAPAVLAAVGAVTDVSAGGMNAAVAHTNATENEALPTAAAALAAAVAAIPVPTGSVKAEAVKVTALERKTIKVMEAVSATVTQTIKKAVKNDGASTSASYAEVSARKTLAVVSIEKRGP